MKQTLLIVITCAAMNLYASKQRPSSGVPMGYELYSWQQPNGSWSFSLLPSPSGVNVSAQEVFNKKFHLSGVKELKRKISGLPAGATIYWLNRISGTDQKAKQGEKLSYPPSETMQDIRHYAEARKIKVEMLSGQQAEL
jgi:hypothetical protein